MRKIHTALDGVFIIELDKCSDKRGYFIETCNKKKFELLDLHGDFVQDNQSLSVHTGTIRGLHFWFYLRCSGRHPKGLSNVWAMVRNNFK